MRKMLKLAGLTFIMALVFCQGFIVPAQAATISGRVTDGTDGIPGVTVNLYHRVTGDFAGAYAATNTNGDYNISCAAGQYVVRAYGAGAGPYGYVSEYWDDQRMAGNATVIDIADAETRAGIDFVLNLGGAIKGTVTNCSVGSALNRLSVFTYTETGLWVDATFTDNNGNFHQGGLEGGRRYLVEIVAYGTDYMSKSYDDNVLISVGQITDAGGICLNRGGTIGGKVNNTTGSGISGVMVTAYTASGHYVSDNLTDSNGDYEVSGLTSNSYWVEANAHGTDYISEYFPELVSIDDTGIVSASSVNFTLELGCSIQGAVEDASGGLYRITVQAYDAYNGAWINNARTDVNGDYSIKGLLPRSYRIEADTYGTDYIKEFYQDVFAFENATVVTCGSSPGVIRLVKGESISGKITDGSLEIGGIVVNAYVYNPDWQEIVYGNEYDYFSSSQTDIEGNYRIGGLHSDQEYIIEANMHQTGYVVVYYDGTADGTINMGEAKRLTPSETGIDFSLKTGNSISGMVTAATDDAGIGGITILAYAETGIGSYGYEYITAALSQDDGNYSIDGLPEEYSNYIIECNPHGYPYLAEFYHEDQSIESASVVIAGATGINFSLEDSELISGTVVTYLDGGEVEPVPSITMLAYNVKERDDEGNVLVGYAASGVSRSNGKYIIYGVSEGDHIVEADTYGTFYQNEYYDDNTSINSAVWVMVPAGGIGGIDFVLDRGSVITGLVSEGIMASAEDPAVTATEASTPKAIITVYAVGSDMLVAQTSNESGGAFTLTSLPGGYYTVKAEASGYAPANYPSVKVVLGKETTLSIELYPDSDGDGLPNWWEEKYGLDDADGDADGDGLTNLEEYENGTDPTDTDTDNDGMGDAAEVEYGLDPLINDADGDADGDGLSNYFELEAGCDPVQPPADIYVAVDSGSDETGDGSQRTPYGTIPKALESACTGDTVRVLTGEYTLDATLPLKPGVKLIGVRAQDCSLNLVGNPVTCADYSTLAGFTINEGTVICSAVVSARVSNNIISGSSGTGIVLNNSSVEVVNNTLLKLDVGIDLANNATPTIYNNIIAYNEVGIETDGTANLTEIDYNNLWSNGSSLSLADHDINSDPLFVDEANANYHLQFDSPARDTGNPVSVYNDKDGSYNDRGADGGSGGVPDENVPAVKIICPESADVFDEVSFICSVSDEWGIYSYAWDFGDGSGMVNGSITTHTYNDCGRYIVTLSVWDNSGLEASAIHSINIGDPPAASISAAGPAGPAPLTVNFSAQAANVSSWSWDFDALDGIGLDSSLENPSHKYLEPGGYVVTLAVTGGSCQATAISPITVLDSDSQLTTWQLLGWGGGIVTAGGISLEIPPGTLSQAAIIALAQAPSPTGLPNGLEVIGTVLDVGPSGLGLSQPGDLKLPYDEDELQTITGSADPYQLMVYTCDNSIYSCRDEAGWQEIPTNAVGDGIASFGVSYFSLYALVVGGEAPQAPNNLTLTPKSSTTIRLNWRDNSDDEEGFKIFRDGSPIATIENSDINSFRDLGLNPETTYSYTVRAYNRFGISESSNTARASTASAPNIAGDDDNPDAASDGGGSTTCFVATAAYGTPMTRQVSILCRFRDKYLLTNKPGSKFVEFYYRNSPPIARYIADRPYLKTMVRTILFPFIGFSWLMLVTSLWQKAALLLLLPAMGCQASLVYYHYVKS